MQTGFSLSKAHQAFVSNDPSFRTLGKTASTVDPLSWALPRLGTLNPEKLEEEMHNPELSSMERSAARLIRDNYALLEALLRDNSNSGDLSDAAQDLSHLHALKFATEVLWSSLVHILDRCKSDGFFSAGIVQADDVERFSSKNPGARGVKFLLSVLRVRKAMGLGGFNVLELSNLAPQDFYRTLQLEYLAARKNDASLVQLVSWIGAAFGASFGGAVGAMIGAGAAYFAWNKAARRVNYGKALELLVELEGRGLRRYFDRSENAI